MKKYVKADICVVGAGISGISAAVEAARLGLDVVLVDGFPGLGGQAVHSIVGTFCGLYHHGENRYQFTHGIADDILHDLGAQGALHYRHGPSYTTVLYDEVALSRWVERTVLDCGITAIVGAVLREVKTDGRRICFVDLATRYGEVRICANGFVDATGDAALAWLAGLPCREPARGPIYGSQMIVIESIAPEYVPSREELAARLREKGAKYNLVRRDGFAFVFPQRGTALVNLTHMETPLDPVDATMNGLRGKEQADRALEFLKGEFPVAFGNARIRSYGFPGIRQTRWIVGVHHLTVDEVRAGKRFPDAVARTAWPIELHDHIEGYIWEPFDDDHVHYVPLGSLLSPDADNLVAVGRCIDADAAALSSVRVMGPCIAMGAAAAHVLHLAGSGSVHEIDKNVLQHRLYDNVVRTD
ncbi:FAD-dependent oxidoreductase [Alicyclobacillus kakegawensis]|uniref:FAD-dependent oxidoreductase n=1 Tax=Alicyclobacillus kakegawensis TaxID=392012 RepID=UPI001C3F3B3C|nr:FAD-dependent oxidoreductase [Alicyclobacillus kakegawensis]